MKNNVIEQYEQDENIMIQLYAQWCINHDLDSFALYQTAYPDQKTNDALASAIEETEKNALEVDTETVIQVLQLFGNDHLAFVVSEIASKLK